VWWTVNDHECKSTAECQRKNFKSRSIFDEVLKFVGLYFYGPPEVYSLQMSYWHGMYTDDMS